MVDAGRTRTSLVIPEWLPEPVREAFERAESEFEGEDTEKWALILPRLLKPEMQSVWRELYRRRRGTQPVYFHPAKVWSETKAKSYIAEADSLTKLGGTHNLSRARELRSQAEYFIENPYPRIFLNEQDEGVYLFAWHVACNSVQTKPIFVSDVKALVAEFYKQQTIVSELAKWLENLDEQDLARDARNLADDLEDRGRSRELRPPPGGEFFDDPSFLQRRTPDADLRVLLGDLEIPALSIFGESLYGTLATIASAVTGQPVGKDRVREILDRRPGIRWGD
jgi:hypothetical protein